MIELNTGFKILAPFPIDSRMVVSTYAGLALIAVKYIGLKTYVVDEDAEYRYSATGWVEITSTNGGGDSSAVWGLITGTLSDQVDLQGELNLKVDKSGGTITGRTSVLSEVDAYNFILAGSTASEIGTEYVLSSIIGEPVGSSLITNAVFISTADHASAVIANTLVATTFYVII